MADDTETDFPRCRVVVEKQAGTDEDKLCGEPASCQWPIIADDGETVLDLLFACPYHEARYEEGHTLIARDMRGFVHMFGLTSETKEDTITPSDDASRRPSVPTDPTPA